MKKKIISLFLAAVTLFAALFALTACGDEEGSGVDTRNFTTLSMWLIWEGHNPQDDSAVEIEQKIEDEFNRITMETYSTKMEFTWFASEAAYKEALALQYQNFDPENVSPDLTDPSDDSSEGGTVNDDYPELKPGQVDIVLMLDKDMLYSYAREEKIVPLDTFLKGSFKNVYNELSSIIRYAKVPLVTETTIGTTTTTTTTYANYAIPNMNSVGEYTYLKVNKAVADYFNYKPEAVDTFAEAMALLYEVERTAGTPYVDYAFLKEAFPYYNSFFYTPYDANGNGVWNPLNQTGTNGLLATFWDASKGYATITQGDVKISLEDQNYLSYLALMNFCETNGKFSEENYIVSVEKGDYAARNDEDYYFAVLDAPRMTDEDLFNGMWSISAYTVNAARSMEIIAALETDEQLLNTLVYGVKGDHYSFNNADKTVQSIGSYYMNPKYAGNLCYVYADKTQTGTNHGFSVAEKEAFLIQKTQWMRELFVDLTYLPELSSAVAYTVAAVGETPATKVYQMDVIQKASDDIFTVLFADAPLANVTLADYVNGFKTFAKNTMDDRLADLVDPNDEFSQTVYDLIKNTHLGEGRDLATQAPRKNRLTGNILNWTLYQLVPEN